MLDRVLNIKCLAVVYKYISELTIVDCKNRPKPLYFISYTTFCFYIYICLVLQAFFVSICFTFYYNGFEYILTAD